ncbi:MAG: hypothetical protein K6L81_06175 [Agarilytica sp.]
MKLKIGLIIFFSLFSLNTYAVKECSVSLYRVYVGDANAVLWLTFKNGGHAHVDKSDINYEAMLSVALAAKLADRTITVRFEDTNAVCNEGTRGDLRGIWLH